MDADVKVMLALMDLVAGQATEEERAALEAAKIDIRRVVIAHGQVGDAALQYVSLERLP